MRARPGLPLIPRPTSRPALPCVSGRVGGLVCLHGAQGNAGRDHPEAERRDPSGAGRRGHRGAHPRPGSTPRITTPAETLAFVKAERADFGAIAQAGKISVE